MTLIFTYSSGRCGTGYLSYIFGGSDYSKSLIHFNENNIISHEPWIDIPVYKIKKENQNSEKYFSLCKNYLDDKLINFSNNENIFITDHKLGRYFLPFLINYKHNYKFKILKINRDNLDIAKSFESRLNKKEIEYNSLKFKKYYNELWENSLFEPSDIFININENIIDWKNFSNFNKFYWYANEVSNQWTNNRLRLSNKQYLEINFKKFINNEIELNKISNFINIKYKKNIIGKKINE